MTHHQVRSALAALKNVKSLVDAAQIQLLRYETDEELIKKDATCRKTFLQQHDEAYQTASTLYEANQKINCTTRALKRLEDKQATCPSKDYSKPVTLLDNQLADAKASLNEAELPLDHPLWTTYDDLEDRMQVLLTVDVSPPDTKDFPRTATKGPYKISYLVVPKFNGKIENWISFWEEFDHAVNAKIDMDDSTKLVYLKQAILDPRFKQTVADLGIKDKAYATALKILHDRFNKPRIIHKQCCEALKSIPINNNSRTSLSEMADKIQHIVSGLERLEMLGAKEIITSMAELSMNQDLKHHWLNYTDKLTTTPPVEDLIAYIRKRADQAENEESTSHHSKP